MKHVVLTMPLLLIFGITIIGCRATVTPEVRRALDSDIDTRIQKYQKKQVNQGVEDWVVLGENRLPAIPGRMYVQKTESGSRIWHTTRSTSKSWDGKTEIHSVKGPELSEKQKSDLLNNGVEPVGWEVVYLDEKGNYIPQDR